MKRNRLALLVLGAAACTRNPYVIGAVCPAADASTDPRCGARSGTTFAVDFATSGASQLGPLALPSGDVAPSWRLLGQGASAAGWTADVGGSLGATNVALPNDAAPFTDSTPTRAAVLAAMSTYVAADATVGAVGADDFALEIVLRAAAGASVLDKRAGATGWSLQENAGGQLVLGLDDGAAPLVEVASGMLTTGAWYHCLYWVSRAVGARADCDGEQGTLVGGLSALGALDSATKVAAGGGAAAEVAEVAVFRVPAGGLGDQSTWLDVDGRRFAALTGTSPRIARGSASAAAHMRDTVAYLDLQSATGPRALFLVGAQWPRVACRVDALGARDCGYLSEAQRTRHVPADPRAWQASELTLADGASAFPDPLVRFAVLTPSAMNATHALSFTGAFGAVPQIFSFFANAGGTAARLDVSVGAAGTAVFDLAAGTIVSAPRGARATIEAWGAGTFRCVYAFTAAAGPATYTIRLTDGAGNETFAGPGASTVQVAGMQLDTGLAFVGSLLGADTQAADHLTFRADGGNLPTGSAATIGLRVLLPAGARLNDQAIVNINHDGSFDDQIQLFLNGDAGPDAGFVKFWGLSTGATHWTFDSSKPVIDGARHALTASWDVQAASLAVDGASAMEVALISNAQPFVLNLIDIGFSETSSGALEGLVAGLQIGAM